MKIQRILIAVDDSRYAEHAAEYGFELAHTYKAEVGLVNIVEPMVVTAQATDMITGAIFEPVVSPDPQLLTIQKEASEKIIGRTAEHLAGNLQVTRFSEFGNTADGILECAAQFGADLIVVGTHSRSGLDRLFVGSIAEDVIRHSNVPVLVIPFEEVD